MKNSSSPHSPSTRRNTISGATHSTSTRTPTHTTYSFPQHTPSHVRDYAEIQAYSRYLTLHAGSLWELPLPTHRGDLQPKRTQGQVRRNLNLVPSIQPSRSEEASSGRRRASGRYSTRQYLPERTGKHQGVQLAQLATRSHQSPEGFR